MRTVSISELKARLSAFLDVVREGEDVLVTDRGRLIARLTPVRGGEHEESRRETLLRTGRLRAPSAALPKNFLTRHRPSDATGASLAALLGEREDGR
ncbi:MAG: type II toxin-antitoxin system prevent-host-death family antitoxin [Gemmatimonadaceae bacterium]